jgi:pilus assembly protein CpaE
MDANRRGREQTLTALLISLDREIGQRLLATIPESRAFQILAEMRSYPALSTLEIRLRQLKPDVILIDVASEPEVASSLIQFAASFQPPVQVVGLHRENNGAALVRALREGASEFLSFPFAVNNQREAVARLRRLREPDVEQKPTSYGKVLVFCSAKPGAGSSTLATHVAQSIRKTTGSRVLLADFDLEGGTLAFYLKLSAAYSLVDLLDPEQELNAAAWSSVVTPATGIDVLAAPDHPYSQAVDPTRLHDILEAARLAYDWIVVDAPSVFHRSTLIALSESDRAYLISTSDLASLHLARRAIGLLTQLGFAKERYEVVVNRLSRRDGIGGNDIEKIFNCPVHATLPNDYFSLHRVISLGQTLGSDCELGRALASLAAKACGAVRIDKSSPGTMADARPALSQT